MATMDDHRGSDALELAPAKIRQVRCDLDYVKTSMGAELWKVSNEVKDARSAVGNHESELMQLWRATRAAEAEMRELNRLVERMGGQLRNLLDEARVETGALQNGMAKGFEESRTLMESRVEEIRNIVRAVDAEQTKALKEVLRDMQAWQVQAELRILKVDGVCQVSDAANKNSEEAKLEVRRAHEELVEVEKDLTTNQKSFEETIRAESRELATKQARCASELHRLVRGLTQKVEASQDQGTELSKDVERLRPEIAACRDWAQEQIDASMTQQASRAEKARASMEQHFAAQLSTMDSRIVAVSEYSSGLSTTLATTESRLASEDLRTRGRIESEIVACRNWVAERIEAEVQKTGKQIAELSSEIMSLRGQVSCVEERSGDLAATMTAVEGRLISEDNSIRASLSTLTTTLAAAESRLAAEDAMTRKQVADLSAALSSTEARLKEETAALQTRHEAAICEHNAAHQRLSNRLEASSVALSTTESRLTSDDAVIRERLEALSSTLASVDSRLSADDAAARKLIDAVTMSIATVEGRLNKEVAVAQERLEALTAALANADSRLTKQDAAARERLDALSTAQGVAESRFSNENAVIRSRLEAATSEQAKVEHRLGTEASTTKKQLDALGVSLAGAESKFSSEAAFARERIETLQGAIEVAESRRSSEDAGIRERVDGVSAALAAAEKRLGCEVSVYRDRLEAINVSLANTAARLDGEDAATRKRVEAVSDDISRLERDVGADDAETRGRVEALAGSLSNMEIRLVAEDTAIRDKIEDRVKEEITWVLAMVKPLQRSIDKLAWGFHDLGCSHVKCSREFEVLEQVVKDVEFRALPWRSGLDREGLQRARDAVPQSEMQPLATEASELSLANTSPGRRIGRPKRPASARHGTSFKPGVGPEWGAGERPMSARPGALPAGAALSAARSPRLP